VLPAYTARARRSQSVDHAEHIPAPNQCWATVTIGTRPCGAPFEPNVSHGNVERPGHDCRALIPTGQANSRLP